MLNTVSYFPLRFNTSCYKYIQSFAYHSLSYCTAFRMTSTSASSNTKKPASISYITGKQASDLDIHLMQSATNNGLYQYQEPQLMELAGLSVASAIMDAFENQYFLQKKQSANIDHPLKCLLLCGPGNNGGDGLVCARHLKLFNIFQPSIYYPRLKNPKKEFYKNLMKQCESFAIPIFDDFPTNEELASYDLIIDSIFGYSFVGPLRGLWKEKFPIINEVCAKCNIPIIAVDVPSGWNIDHGPHVDDICLNVNILVSLSVPKYCAKKFQGIHYLGGRFMPPSLCQMLGVCLPQYPGACQAVRIDQITKNDNCNLQETFYAGKQAGRAQVTREPPCLFICL